MRSRFSAFALGLAPYLLATWHPSTRPATLSLDPSVEWRRLQVVDVSGEVMEFRASYRGGLLHERSRFLFEHGRWFYLAPVE